MKQSLLYTLATLLLVGGTTLVLAQDQAITWSADDPELNWGLCPEFIPDDCRLAVLHGDPAGHNADVFSRLQPGTTAAHHWHSSAERIPRTAAPAATPVYCSLPSKSRLTR